MYLDTHLHILPGIDDGPTTAAESVELARALVERGFEEAVATPHIRPGLFDNDPEAVRSRTAEFASLLRGEGVGLTLHPGAEHYLDADVYEMIARGRGVPLGGGGSAILLEVSFLGPVANLPDRVFSLRLKGLTPVFAHPERCAVFQDLEVARLLVEGGAHLQLGLGSLAGAYGKPPRALARKLLDRGLYALAATDLHDARQAREELDEWLDALTAAAGDGGRDRLLSSNPRRLLAGGEVLV